jgi:hypothetical protein
MYIPILKIHGARLFISPSIILVAVIGVLSLRFGLFPFWYDRLSVGNYWVMAILTTLGIFISLVAHDCAHLLTSCLVKQKPANSQIFLFGELPLSEREKSYFDWRVALAGPLFSSLAGLLCVFLAVSVDKQGMSQSAVGILFHLGAANFTLALLNFLPFLPLDMGRMLNSSGTNRFAVYGGVILPSVLIFLGWTMVLRGVFFVGSWFIILAIAMAYAVIKRQKL